MVGFSASRVGGFHEWGVLGVSDLRQYQVLPCERRDIRDFIERWHYSHNINGITGHYFFKLLNTAGELVGGAIFGSPAMPTTAKKYGCNTTELRRLVLVDDTPRNAESYFIGKMLRWLRRNTQHDVVLSYADETYGHTGVIYRASNFRHLGKTQPGRNILYNGKLYHDKVIRTKNKGILKPFAIEIRAALAVGTAVYVKNKPKNIYVYRLV